MFGAVLFFRHEKNKAPKISYSIIQAKIGSISEIVETTGEISALNRVEIKPSISGQVDKLLVDEGDDVKKGQILAYISSNDRVAILDAVRANENEKLAEWENTYKPTPVISPMDGKIILRNVVEGQTITNTDILFALADKLIVLASVDEADIGSVKVGQKAAITLDAYENITVEGKVFQILEEGKNVNNVITYYVKIESDTFPDFFKSLMTANIAITINEIENAITIPWLAINEDDYGNSYVLLQEKGNYSPIRKDIKIGLQDAEKVEILSGLDEGDEILMKNENFSLGDKNGMKSFMKMDMSRKKNSEILGVDNNSNKKKRG
jgi:macrolide-specific efflux system membrane fusion protein